MKAIKKILCALMCIVLMTGMVTIISATAETKTLAQLTALKNSKKSFIVYVFDDECENYAAMKTLVDSWKYSYVYAVDAANGDWAAIPEDYKGKHAVIFIDGGEIDVINEQTGIFECTGDEAALEAIDAFYAEFIIEHTLTYDANGGTGGPVSQVGNGTVTIATGTPTRTDGNYEFLGWTDVKNSDVVKYKAGETYELIADVTFYAVWEALSGYYVSFDTNGGNVNGTKVIDSIPIKVDDNGRFYAMLSPAAKYTPSQSGKTFSGWTYGSGVNETTVMPSDTEPVYFTKAESVKLTAKWGNSINTDVDDVSTNTAKRSNSAMSLVEKINKNVRYKDKVEITVTVTNLAAGDTVYIYGQQSRQTPVARATSSGGDVTLTYKSDKLENDTAFSVVVKDADGTVCTNSIGSQLRTVINANVEKTFFNKIRAAVLGIFNIESVTAIK